MGCGYCVFPQSFHTTKLGQIIVVHAVIPLINCKVELKLKWTKHCVLSTVGADNDNANPRNIIFTIKDTKLYVSVVTLSEKDNPKLSNLRSKGFEISVYWNEYKTKSENKNTANEYWCFLESNFVGFNRLFALRYLNRNNNVEWILENII